MSKRRFVIRTIRNGSVKIFGKTFVPDEKWMKYGGRLDGLRFAFGLYYDVDGRKDLVNLWGTKAEYNGLPAVYPHVVDGALPWLFWIVKI